MPGNAHYDKFELRQFIFIMKCIHIITPVKDSIELTLQTAEAILKSDFTVPFHYTIYNDFSTDENTKQLKEASLKMGFELVNLSEITSHPSPNYLLVLQMAQEKAIAAEAGLLIVESDVIVKKHTVDEHEAINYPYLYAKGKENQVFPEKKHLSFCCSLLTTDFLRAFDFHSLNPEKNWFDVTISHQALEKGFVNYLFTTLTVWHRPHSSRPWKQLKYTNPLKYYWLKFTKGLDKI